MSWLVKRFGSEWASRIICAIVAVLVIGVTCMLAYCTGHHDGKTGEVVKEQQATIKVQQQQGAANEAAADQRVHDIVEQKQQQQELDNATIDGSDLTRAQRGCVIMREQGRDTSHIPACVRP